MDRNYFREVTPEYVMEHLRISKPLEKGVSTDEVKRLIEAAGFKDAQVSYDPSGVELKNGYLWLVMPFEDGTDLFVTFRN